MRQETRSDPWISRPSAAWIYTIALAILAVSAGRSLLRAHADRLSLSTGPAQWIWYTGRIPQPRPLRFYATRDFELAQAPVRAFAKLFVDREHALYVNGRRAGAGAQHPGDPLAVYDLTRLLTGGLNRVAIEASSPNGIGGILFSLDLDAHGRNAVFSDGKWRVDLSAAAIRDGGRYRPQVWGRPPQYPWRYPRLPRPNEVAGRKP